MVLRFLSDSVETVSHYTRLVIFHFALSKLYLGFERRLPFDVINSTFWMRVWQCAARKSFLLYV